MRASVLTGLLAAAASACGPSSGGDGCKDHLLPGDLVITEVFADSKAPPGGSGTDEGKEWFEIYNASDRPLELKGLTVTHSRPDDSKAKSHTMEDITIAPGQYMTLGNTTEDLLPPYIDYGFSSDLGDFFNTDGGKLKLSCKDSEIDSATYEDVKEGHSRELTSAQPPDYTLNDDIGQWCQANDSEFDTGNFGTPGSESDCTPVVVGQCLDAGTMRDTVAPGVGDLVITELMPKPKTLSATTAQWFEVLAKTDVDLNGVGLDRANDNNIAPQVLDSPDCIHLAAGQYGIFARSADPGMNGGLANTLGTFSFSLNPSMNADVQLVYGGTVIDAVTWTTSATGASLSLDPDFVTSTGNDEPTNFCNGVDQYEATGPNLGTPGAVNAQCATVSPPGMCDDNGTLRAIVKPTAGQLVITEILADPAGTDTNKEWFEVTNTGATAFDLNELGVTNGNVAPPTPTPILSSKCVSVAPAGFALLAQSPDPLVNGGLPEVDATFSMGLTNSGASAGVQIFDGATLLDGVKEGTAPASKSLSLDPDHFNTTDNDTGVVTAGVYCAGTTAYGDMTNLGTPKAANPQCP